jgi:hypothetical protein
MNRCALAYRAREVFLLFLLMQSRESFSAENRRRGLGLPSFARRFLKVSIGRVLGFVLLIGGVVLIIMGVVESRSLANSLSRVLIGRLSQHTMLYIFGGIASAVVGLILTTGVLGRSRS